MDRKREGGRTVKEWSYRQLRNLEKDTEWTVCTTWNKQMIEVAVRALISRGITQEHNAGNDGGPGSFAHF